MKAFLLAAGVGSRLRPHTDTTPKCLMPINGVPLLDIWITLLEKHNIREVLINTHHLADQVNAFVQNIQKTRRISITLTHENCLLGSGGTILKNKAFVADEPDFFIIYADNLTDIHLGNMMDFHLDIKNKGGMLTMGLFHAPCPRACGIAELDPDKKIITFIEKPENPSSDLANGGIYITTPEIFNFFPESWPENSALDLGFHVLPGLNGRMFGYEITEYLKDIGTIKAYEQACEDWKTKELGQYAP